MVLNILEENFKIVNYQTKQQQTEDWPSGNGTSLLRIGWGNTLTGSIPVSSAKKMNKTQGCSSVGGSTGLQNHRS